MPIYVYRCQDCLETVEVLHRTSTIDQPECCPHCGKSSTLQRLISAVSSVVRSSSPGCDTPTGQCGMQTGVCGGGQCAFQ